MQGQFLSLLCRIITAYSKFWPFMGAKMKNQMEEQRQRWTTSYPPCLAFAFLTIDVDFERILKIAVHGGGSWKQ